MKKFKNYLLNEEANFLGHRVGDILTAMQDVQQDMPNLGTRHLTKIAEELVNQIRKILHGSWSAKHQKDLRELQKVGVAIMKTIEEKGDLKEIIPAATQQLQNLSGKLKVKVNNLEAPQMPGEDISQNDFQLTGQGPEQPPQQPPQGAPQPQQPPQNQPQGAPQPQPVGAAIPGMSG